MPPPCGTGARAGLRGPREPCPAGGRARGLASGRPGPHCRSLCCRQGRVDSDTLRTSERAAQWPLCTVRAGHVEKYHFRNNETRAAAMPSWLPPPRTQVHGGLFGRCFRRLRVNAWKWGRQATGGFRMSHPAAAPVMGWVLPVSPHPRQHPLFSIFF